MAEQTKSCKGCKGVKALIEFNSHPSTRDRLQQMCRVCDNAHSRASYGENRDRRRAKVAEYQQHQDNREWRCIVETLRRYNITLDQYHSMQEAQDFSCAICGDVSKLGVDHDHSCCDKGSCGRCVRALLCMNCNNGLGCFRDRPHALQNAVAYLALNS